MREGAVRDDRGAARPPRSAGAMTAIPTSPLRCLVGLDPGDACSRAGPPRPTYDPLPRRGRGIAFLASSKSHVATLESARRKRPPELSPEP